MFAVNSFSIRASRFTDLSKRAHRASKSDLSIEEIGRQFASTALVANDKAQVTLDTIISAKDVHGLLNIT